MAHTENSNGNFQKKAPNWRKFGNTFLGIAAVALLYFAAALLLQVALAEQDMSVRVLEFAFLISLLLFTFYQQANISRG